MINNICDGLISFSICILHHRSLGDHIRPLSPMDVSQKHDNKKESDDNDKMKIVRRDLNIIDGIGMFDSIVHGMGSLRISVFGPKLKLKINQTVAMDVDMNVAMDVDK